MKQSKQEIHPILLDEAKKSVVSSPLFSLSFRAKFSLFFFLSPPCSQKGKWKQREIFSQKGEWCLLLNQSFEMTTN